MLQIVLSLFRQILTDFKNSFIGKLGVHLQWCYCERCSQVSDALLHYCFSFRCNQLYGLFDLVHDNSSLTHAATQSSRAWVPARGLAEPIYLHTICKKIQRQTILLNQSNELHGVETTQDQHKERSFHGTWQLLTETDRGGLKCKCWWRFVATFCYLRNRPQKLPPILGYTTWQLLTMHVLLHSQLHVAFSLICRIKTSWWP